ncbi:hypothetical protein [Aureliella helgolandensis]|uniref:Uncharacterized protein n=1 Tax=Aureliella helgolandensis TaxID=2527968 RepID=A0A518G2S2_9BACT|nr:hypothetical protein [Aureliella helgolandensis]QDV22901.1 hypothetical protein Q31a_11940 [Aureliella helgolandensis]
MLELDRKPLSVIQADASLFAGRLGIDIETDFGAIALDNIPVPDVSDFTALLDYRIRIPNCHEYNYEDPLLRPWFSTEMGYSDVNRLDTSLRLRDDRLLSVTIDLSTSETEGSLPQNLRGSLLANCSPVDSTQLLTFSGPIPIRFAESYLPILGLPSLPSNATLKHVTSAFGKPDHTGGSANSKHGSVPAWIRYTLPSCYLRFQIEGELISIFTIMSLSDPPCDLL